MTDSMGFNLNPETPTFRPSANACSVEPHTKRHALAAIGWVWLDGAWRSACEDHATVIPAWQSGDWRHRTALVRP